MSLADDARLDPRIAKVLAAVPELAPGVEPPPLGSPIAACLDYCRGFEDANRARHGAAWAAMPAFDAVETTVETIDGVDGNAIELHVHRPTARHAPLPCVVHLHGGGMVMMAATDPGSTRYRNSLAAAGLVVVGVEFRNGGGRLGDHPFPAGLNDCASAVRWTYANRERLGVSKVVVAGQSGGGNLSIATALKAKGEGWGGEIGGVFAMCPYIFGGYAEPPAGLPSLLENDGYLLGREMMAALATVYDPTGDHASDPLAWPLHAAPTDLAGLPPHVVVVNELDPLRDEGLAFYRKLLAAGVPAVGRTAQGTPHSGDIGYPDITPEVYADNVSSVLGFANSLA